MTPVIVVLVPLHGLAAALGLLNTCQVLVVVFTAWQLPGKLWLIRSFLDAIPPQLEEAAMIDGCTRIGTFFRVVLPQLIPDLVAAGMIVFVQVWNEFIIVVSLGARQDMPTMPVGLYSFRSDFGGSGARSPLRHESPSSRRPRCSCSCNGSSFTG